MADERKRIIEQTASTEIFDDDWFIKDSALHNTTKISQTVLKQEILKDVKGVVELTQAEYDALPSSKLTDGILYAIKDSEDIIGNIENAINTLSGDIDDLEELVSTEMYNTAPMWSDASYTFDDLVVYGIDGRLYRCIVRNSTANQFVSSEWQATDIKAELYLLLQRIAPQFIASSQSYTQVYYEGNLVLHTNDYGVNTFFVCKQDLPQGDTEWVANHWEEVNTVSGLSKYLMDKIAEAGQIDDVQVKTTGDYESVVDDKVAKIDLSNMLIEKSVPNLPQSVATFNDGSDLPLKSLTASIVPVQAGSGDPSPTNERPISGWTEEVIRVTDDLQNPTVTHTTTIPFTDSQGQSVEVFGGSVDVVNGGEQPQTFGSVDMGDLNWTFNRRNNADTGNIFYTRPSDMKNSASSICSIFTEMREAGTWEDLDVNKYLIDGSHYLVVCSTEADATAFKTAMSGQKLVYELATPTTFYTQPTSIKSLDGENNLSASTGEVTKLEYIANATDVIANLEARVTALENQ